MRPKRASFMFVHRNTLKPGDSYVVPRIKWYWKLLGRKVIEKDSGWRFTSRLWRGTLYVEKVEKL